MTRFLPAVAALAALMGAAVIVPVAYDVLENGQLSGVGLGVALVGAGLLACGFVAGLLGYRRRLVTGMPSGVRAAVAANIIFLAFCALELSDCLVRQDGRVFYWTTFLFLPAMLLLVGLLSARRWAWWTTRGAAAFAVLWFLGFVLVIPFAPLMTDGVSVPWYGRVYMTCVTIGFASVFAAAFWSLGCTEARNYFGLSVSRDR